MSSQCRNKFVKTVHNFFHSAALIFLKHSAATQFRLEPRVEATSQLNFCLPFALQPHGEMTTVYSVFRDHLGEIGAAIRDGRIFVVKAYYKIEFQKRLNRLLLTGQKSAKL